MSTLSREQILGLIPHAGAMCLLDTTESWNTTEIICLSTRYALPDNPLRQADGTLGSASLIEIAAQAMALHGRLSAPRNAPPRPGLLVSLRDVMLYTGMLDGTHGPVRITVKRSLGDARGASYVFEVDASGQRLAEGRAMVLFEIPE